MKKRNVIYIFAMLFSFIFGLNQVNAIDKYTIQDSKYFDSYSNCCYKDENKGNLAIYRNGGGVTLYVREVPKHTYLQWNPFGKTHVDQRLICTSNNDGSTVEIEARVYEDATKFDTNNLNGGVATGSVCTSSTSCTSTKEIKFSRCDSGRCFSSEFVEGYTSCEMIGAVSNDDIYARAAYKKVDGKDGVIFYVVKSDQYVSKYNKFSCVKVGTDNERECVNVKVEDSATVSGEDTNSGINNLDNDSKTITSGASKEDMIGYDSCHFASTGDERNKYVNIVNNTSIRVASIPTENTNIYLKCKPNGATAYRDVTITVTPTATIFIDYDNPENNKTSEDEDNSYYVPGDCESILGDVNKKGDVAYYLQKIFNFMKFLGPILVICLIVMDSVKAVASGDKDALNKLLTSSAKRIIFAVLLFVFPTVLNLVLSWISTHGTCKIT